MEIHLAKPGGERQGPFTLEQLNRDLAVKKYTDAEFWAWYDGADAWVPLYSVPGILGTAATAAAAVKPVAPEQSAAPTAPVETQPQEDETAIAKLASGMPFETLEHIFIFTSGEGPDLLKSPVSTALIEKIVGEKWAVIREKVRRDVFGRCDIGQKLRAEGKVPESAWRAMSALKPELIQQARAGAFRTTVRTFSLDSVGVAAVFLFYRKEQT
jgi:hypothetical protein